MDRIRIRKRMSVRRRSAPPVEVPPKTWAQLVFFPISLIALAFMAAMLLIFVASSWLFRLEDEAHEDHPQLPAMRGEFASPRAPSVDVPPQAPELRPPGGIVIEK